MQWQILPKTPEYLLKQFPEYSPLMLQLLYNRGLETQAAIDEFFNPDFIQDIHDPFLMKGMAVAVARLQKALVNREKICIYGDYDVDGVCGTLILKSALENLGAESIDIYIPDRAKEGYGLNSKAIKELARKKNNLIITVDCGITNFDEVAMANSLGMEVLLTDHHRIIDKLPAAQIVVDPHQPDDNYPFKFLAGAGVAYKLVQALFINSQERDSLKKENQEIFCKWLLDLVALATLADGMPLLGENRTLVKYGLIVLAQTRRAGLKELMKKSNLAPALWKDDKNLLVTNLDAQNLVFTLVPRLNAAGRMDHANSAFYLLASASPDESALLAEKLNQLNQDRQNSVEKIIKEIEKRLQYKNIIVEGGDNWPLGIVGLIAGRLSDKYHRPVIIFSREENKIDGSGRSLQQFNLVEAFKKCSDLLTRFGGHPQAAGFSLAPKNLESFKQRLNELADEFLGGEDLTPTLAIEAEIGAIDINWQFYDQLQSFAPFGSANHKPIFCVRNLEIKETKQVGNNGKHNRFLLSSAEVTASNSGGRPFPLFKAIAFNANNGKSQETAKERVFKAGDRVDAVFEFIVNEWNDTRDLQLKILDIKLSV